MSKRFFDDSNPDWTQREFDRQLAEAFRQAIATARRAAEAGDPGADREGDQGGGQGGAVSTGARSDRADGPDEAVQAGGESEGLTLASESQAEAAQTGRARLDTNAADREARALADRTGEGFQPGLSAFWQKSSMGDLLVDAPAVDAAQVAGAGNVALFSRRADVKVDVPPVIIAGPLLSLNAHPDYAQAEADDAV